MKKFISVFLIVFLFALSFSSCLESNDKEYQDYLQKYQAEQEKILAQYRTDSVLITTYLAEKKQPAVIDSISGIFYHIVEPGVEEHPNSNSYITVKYKGYLLDGTVFDETPNGATIDYSLGTLIPGWQIGLPLIGNEGKIILYLPSYYGYSTYESAKIPANSVLIFEIELINFY